jgi:hypothetical protein
MSFFNYDVNVQCASSWCSGWRLNFCGAQLGEFAFCRNLDIHGAQISFTLLQNLGLQHHVFFHAKRRSKVSSATYINHFSNHSRRNHKERAQPIGVCIDRFLSK